MLNTQADLISETLVRMGITTTVGFITDVMLNDWSIQAHRWAAGYKKWPFTEGRVSTTYASMEENDYPEGWKTDSVRILTLGGYRFEKKNFEDYQIFREVEPNATDRIFSDFNRVIYINPNSGLSGTTVFYGQYMPAAFDITDNPTTSYTVFSGAEEEGNEAIVQEMLSYAKQREGKSQEALVIHETAKRILDSVWEKIQAEQYAYQTKSRGMFKYFDVLQSNEGPNIDEDQFRVSI